MTRIGLGTLVSTVTLALVVSSAGCGGKKKRDLSGIGPWIIGQTTLEDWGYINMCTPKGDLMWCQASPLEKKHAVALGGQQAAVGTYFKGNQPDAKLVEIVLSVDACEPEKLQSWLRETLGKPSQDRGRIANWAGKLVFVSAELGRSCEVVFVASDDQKRIAELEAKAKE